MKKEMIKKIIDSTSMRELAEEAGAVFKDESSRAVCPWDQHEGNLSFSIHEERGLYRCFRCGSSGDVVSFVCSDKKINREKALRYLAERVGLKEYASKEERETIHLMDGIKKWMDYMNSMTLKNDDIGYQYLKNRGCGDGDILKKYYVFYSSGKKYAKDCAKMSKCGIDDFLSNFIDRYEELFCNSLCFPSFDDNGILCGLKARSIKKKDFFCLRSDWKFHNKSNLFGEHLLSELRTRDVVICEGEFDALKCMNAYRSKYNFDKYIFMAGHPSKDNISRLNNSYVKNIYDVRDMDPAGIDMIERELRGGVFSHSRSNAKIITLDSPFSDPDEYIDEYGVEEFDERISESRPAYLCYLDIIFGEVPSDQYSEDIFNKSEKVIKSLSASMSTSEKACVCSYIEKKTGINSIILMDIINEAKSESHLDSLSNEEEECFLNRLIRDSDFMKWADNLIDASFFQSYTHKAIWSLMREEFIKGELSGDALRLASVKKYNDEKILKTVNHIINLNMPSIYSDNFAERVSRIKLSSELSSAAKNVADYSHNIDEELEKIIHSYENTKRSKEKTILSFQEGVDLFVEYFKERVKSGSEIPGMDFGPQWKDLTSVIGGLRKGVMMILAASHNCGKSAMAASLSFGLSIENNYKGAIISLELSPLWMMCRNIATLAKTDLKVAETGRATQGDLDKILAGAQKACTNDLYLIDAIGSSPAQIVSSVRTLNHAVDLDYVVVDYIQEIDTSGYKSGYEGLGAAAKTLRNSLCCSDMDIAMIMVAQLSREATKVPEPGLEYIADCYRLAQMARQAIIIDKMDSKMVRDIYKADGNGRVRVVKNMFGESDYTIPVFHNISTKETKEASFLD